MLPENIKLEVFSIFEEVNPRFVAVSINSDLFKLIVGTDEVVQLPMISKGKDKAGNTVRAFKIEDTTVYVRYNGKAAQYQNTVILAKEDAERLHTGSSTVFDF